MTLAISFLVLIFLLGSQGFACLWLLSIAKKPPDPPNQGAWSYVPKSCQVALISACRQFFGLHQPVQNSIKYPPTVFSCSIFIVLQTLPRNKVLFSLFFI